MAQRLPRPQPRLNRVVDALTRDAPVTAKDATPEAPKPPQDSTPWDDRFASFLERVMAVAAVGGDPAPLKKELDQLLNEAPPGKREELEKNRGKPPKS